MQKILKIVLIVIGVIAAALSFFFMPSGDDPAAIDSGSIDFMFLLTWLLLIAASALALFFGLKKMLTSPGGLKKALFAIGGLVILFIVGYALSSGEEADAVVNTFDGKEIQPTASTVKTIGMLLNVFFMMTAVAVVLMIVPGFKRILGK